MSTPDLPPAAVPAPAPAKKNNTLVIVLCIGFGVLLLILASCVGTCIYVGKKAKDYAKESERNPKISALALAAAIAPGVEVVSKDLDAGTIVLKNTKTGEVLKLDAKNFSEDKIGEVLEKIMRGKNLNGMPQSGTVTRASESEPAATSAASDSNETVSVAQAEAQEATLKNFPPDFPRYVGGGVTTVEATQKLVAAVSTSQHSFLTNDAPDAVADFYLKQLSSVGYTVVASENGSDSNGAKLSRVFQRGEGRSTFNLEVYIEEGKTRVDANQVVLKQ